MLLAAKTAEELVKVVDELISDGIEPDEAKQVVSSPEALKAISTEQAAEVFKALEVNELTAEEAEQIIEAVQDAPAEIREQFEEEINIFEGTFDEYVPVDSKITVAERRAVVAASAVLSISYAVTSAPAVSSTSSSSSGDRKRLK